MSVNGTWQSFVLYLHACLVWKNPCVCFVPISDLTSCEFNARHRPLASSALEKTAYQEALREEHRCISEHKSDYMSACSKLFMATVRAQQNFGHFIATGESAPLNRAKSVEPELTDQEWPDDVIKAIVARNPYLTPAQKAEQIKLYKYSHS
jgi:hypothetical protein